MALIEDRPFNHPLDVHFEPGVEIERDEYGVTLTATVKEPFLWKGRYIPEGYFFSEIIYPTE